MARLRVLGGPADGLRVAAVPGPYRWIDRDYETGHASPGPRRALYERRGDLWCFVGYRVRACPGCGGYVEGGGACPVCGAAASPSPRRGAEPAG